MNLLDFKVMHWSKLIAEISRTLRGKKDCFQTLLNDFHKEKMSKNLARIPDWSLGRGKSESLLKC